MVEGTVADSKAVVPHGSHVDPEQAGGDEATETAGGSGEMMVARTGMARAVMAESL
tara:strand:- start:302 stop:469 length:168 start_codon:yes stop_codon:yes gene_type:complete